LVEKKKKKIHKGNKKGKISSNKKKIFGAPPTRRKKALEKKAPKTGTAREKSQGEKGTKGTPPPKRTHGHR